MLKKSFYFFMSVVETGSFSQAAKKHYLSQAAISQQISKLEEEVGVRVFDRSKYSYLRNMRKSRNRRVIFKKRIRRK